MDISKQYELNYKSLSLKDQTIVEECLQQAMYDNHINICKECAKKYFAFNGNIDFTKDYAIISEDFTIDNNVCADTICECGECQNESDFTVNLVEEEDI
jgi:hypothetical protein